MRVGVPSGPDVTVVARISGFDDERFQAALRDPSTVEQLTERALCGEDVGDMRDARRTGRFERDREPVATG